MADEVSEVIVFLASPGDLADERAAVRALEAGLNATFSTAGLRVRITGWESLPPAFGRPQELINPMVDEADIVIGLLRRKWGTATGTHETGFIEEFERAVNRRRDHGSAPEISLYFATLTAGETDDAGPELAQVLAFKKRVETEHVALYSNFSSPEDLASQVLQLIDRHLIAKLISRIASTGPDGASGSTSNSDSAWEQIDDTSPEDDEDAGSARRQIEKTLNSLQDLLHGKKPEVPVDRDRLHMLGVALGQDDEALGVHLVNRLFRRREELDLIVAEHNTWVFTLLSDIGRARTTLNRVVPGWGVLVLNNSADVELLVEYAKRDDDAGIGALRSMLRFGLRPHGLWPAEMRSDNSEGSVELDEEDLASVWVSILNAHPGKSVALELLLQDVDTTDGPRRSATLDLFARVLSANDLNDRTRKIVSAAVAAMEGSPDALADALGYSPEGQAPWRLILRQISVLSDKLLNQLAGQKSNRPAAIAAIEAAQERHALTDDVIISLLTREDDAELALLILADIDDDKNRAAKLLSLVNEHKETNNIPDPTKAILLARTGTVEQLQALHADSTYSNAPWEALTYASPTEHLDEARTVVQTGAQALRNRLEPMLTGDNAKLVTYLANDLCRVSADLLSRQDSPSSDDIDLIIGWFESLATSGFIPKSSWTVLERVASESSLEKIDRALRPHADVLGFRSGLERLDGPLGTVVASAFNDSDVDSVRAQARAWIVAQPERTEEELREAIYAEESEVRVAATEALISRLSRDQLISLLDAYSDVEGRFWYNVIALLDEVLYAPSPSVSESPSEGGP